MNVTAAEVSGIQRQAWFDVAAAVYAGVAALLVVNTLPALVNVLAHGLAWNDRALGVFAAADVAGITLGSLVGIPLVQRRSLMSTTLGGVIALVVADIGCGLGGGEFQVNAFRFAGGLASGVILAACYALYSYGNAQRNFASFCLGQMASGLIGVTALPHLAARWGWASSFVFLAAATALAIPLAWWLPRHSAQRNPVAVNTVGAAKTAASVWVAVAGIVVYVIGAGAVWTFMGRMGLASGLSEQDVNFAISGCEVAGILGAAATLFPSRHLGTFIPLTVCALLSAASVWAMRSSNPTIFFWALAVFTFTWLAFATLQFAVIAAADSRGIATISMSTAWYLGFTVGPYLGGSLVEHYGFVPVQIFGAGGVLLALLTLFPLRSRATTTLGVKQ
ncbi:MAG: hypothetical protein JSR66_20005 [Proteobacteria bacterium]|nr:hypothetical protein [Pseudomonadota bacterium]